jgi:Protein of unknown function (DUF3303)
MKFMLTFTYPAGNFLQVVKAWGSMSPQERASAGEGVKKIGHWHDVVGRRGVVIVEANDLAAVGRWTGGWNASVDFVITPVLDDEEAGAVARQITADHNA